MAEQVGGGARRELVFMSHGRIHLRMHQSEPIFEWARVSVEPTANLSALPQTYFRLDGNGKWQWCVLFPSGVSQVLATEP